VAKIRGFKPDLWTDEAFIELSPFARLLWLGMWNYACDNGHLADKSKQIKMRVLPTDDVNCADLLRELADQKLIERADGWITIPNLTRHQKPDRRYFTTCEKEGCDAPPETLSQRESRRAHYERTAGARRATDERTPSAHVDGDGEVKGSDGDRARAGARPGAARGARIPDDFNVTDEMKAWAVEKGFGHLDLAGITEEFFDYWHGIPGARGVKLDWVGTWRNWVRRKAQDNVRPMRREARPDRAHLPEAWR
jgi:hypothetical protein